LSVLINQVHQSILYQLLWRFSPGTPASSTTKTGRHDIAEKLLKVALNTKNQSISKVLTTLISTVPYDIFNNILTILVSDHIYKTFIQSMQFDCSNITSAG
jgi:hypothetical protein